MNKNHLEKPLQLFAPHEENYSDALFIAEGVAAGFPSPAGDFMEVRISLDRELVKNKDATFYARVRGQSMVDAGLNDGDLLIIDRSLEPQTGKVAVCVIDGEFTVKTLKIEKDGLYLMPANSKFKPIKVNEGNNFTVWGIVTHVVKKV